VEVSHPSSSLTLFIISNPSQFVALTKDGNATV